MSINPNVFNSANPGLGEDQASTPLKLSAGTITRNPNVIPDGFSYNARLRFWPYRYYPMALQALDEARKKAISGGSDVEGDLSYRNSAQGVFAMQSGILPRWYGVPQDPTVPIPAGTQLTYQIRMTAGSVIWGYNFCVLAGGAAVKDVRIQIGVHDTGYTMQSQPGQGGAYQVGPGLLSPVIMADLVDVGGSGKIDVVLYNTNLSLPAQCQLLIHCWEPKMAPLQMGRGV